MFISCNGKSGIRDQVYTFLKLKLFSLCYLTRYRAFLYISSIAVTKRVFLRCQNPDTHNNSQTRPGVLEYIGGMDETPSSTGGGRTTIRDGLGSDTGSNTEVKAM